MNVVEDEVVELVSAVLARMVFRLLRQADPHRFPFICCSRKPTAMSPPRRRDTPSTRRKCSNGSPRKAANTGCF